MGARLPYGVGAADPLTLIAVPAVLLLLAAGACLVQGIRASRGSMAMLRAE